jgi:hypothetical protein
MPPVEENEVLKRKSIAIVPDPDAFVALTPRDESPNKKIHLEGELNLLIVKNPLLVCDYVSHSISFGFQPFWRQTTRLPRFQCPSSPRLNTFP